MAKRQIKRVRRRLRHLRFKHQVIGTSKHPLFFYHEAHKPRESDYKKGTK